MREGLEERAQSREVPGDTYIKIVAIGKRGGGANERFIRYSECFSREDMGRISFHELAVYIDD